MMKERGSGILLPVFSLPSPYGVGTLGAAAYEFINFLEKARQKYWQILPVGPTGYGDSPYQSYSVNAGNPYLIDLDTLVQEGLLTEEELPEKEVSDYVDYGKLYHTRYEIFRKAFQRFDREDTRFQQFLEKEEHWLEDYALFMALKEAHSGNSWNLWKKGLRDREEASLHQAKKLYRQEISFWEFLQFLFFRQWREVKAYANEKGIRIIGDIPIYVAYDSVDVWAAAQYYELDANKLPVNVAGCPPDGFSATGQLWGNPLYNWELMRKEGYQWWIQRLDSATTLYDVVRIDHFRGFESYFSIPFGSAAAAEGKWRKGPGEELFKAVKEALGDREFIAEDLGYLTEEVEQLLQESGYPGMKLLQFAFDSREAGNYLPHNYVQNSVVYIGTHDNDTARGWAGTLSHGDFRSMLDYMGLEDDRDFVWKLIKNAMGTVCNTVIIMMQDYLELGSSARLNTPSTTGKNWRWRVREEMFTDRLAYKIADIAAMYERV